MNVGYNLIQEETTHSRTHMLFTLNTLNLWGRFYGISTYTLFQLYPSDSQSINVYIAELTIDIDIIQKCLVN